MIRLYYSGASQYGMMQNNPDNSLGGYMSSSPIPNDFLNNLFGTVSEKAAIEESQEVRAIFIRNEGEAALNDISIYTILPENFITKFEYSPVLSANQKSIEKVMSMRNNPFYADFFEANGLEAKEILIDSLQPNEIFGLWIRRTILPNEPMPKDEAQYQAWFQKRSDKIENIEIILGWEDPVVEPEPEV